MEGRIAAAEQALAQSKALLEEQDVLRDAKRLRSVSAKWKRRKTNWIRCTRAGWNSRKKSVNRFGDALAANALKSLITDAMPFFMAAFVV